MICRMKHGISVGLFATVLWLLGCASTGPVPGPSGPVELDNTRWKLVTIEGEMDGRVVQFQKTDKNRYVGILIDLGHRIRHVLGVSTGSAIFQLKRLKGQENQYQGSYVAIQPTGRIQSFQTVVRIEGGNLMWDLAPALWERVK